MELNFRESMTLNPMFLAENKKQQSNMIPAINSSGRNRIKQIKEYCPS
jgi:hypothetical protein